MHLYLSEPSPLNALYCDVDGRALYMVQTPSSLFERVTDVFCRLPDSLLDFSDSSQSLHYPPSKFGHLATYQWNSWHSSRLRYRELDVETRSFFVKDRWSVFGRGRVFVAPDGLEYKWEIGHSLQLRLNGGKRNPIVARFHPSHGSLFGKHERPWLEIFSRGEHILDTIVVTFVYVERLRQDE